MKYTKKNEYPIPQALGGAQSEKETQSPCAKNSAMLGKANVTHIWKFLSKFKSFFVFWLMDG